MQVLLFFVFAVSITKSKFTAFFGLIIEFPKFEFRLSEFRI